MSNKDLLDSFIPIEQQIKDALKKDIEKIEIIVDQKSYNLDRYEAKCLKLLLGNLKSLSKLDETLIFETLTFKIHANLNAIDVHLFREIIRDFAKNTLEVLIKNKIQIECQVINNKSVWNTQSLVIECGERYFKNLAK